MINPFNITKAVDYTDEELYNSWVDFPNVGFKEIIKPTSEMPMIILGSKGSGKTHVMKHFSFSMQKYRNADNLLHGVIKEGYIGTYLRCSGLNGSKFRGRGETEDTWETIFSYYLELWLGQLILNNVSKFLSSTNINFNEEKVLSNILSLFDRHVEKENIDTIDDLIKYFNNLQKGVDYAINNRALSKNKISENINILLSAGSLIFGIPEVLSENIHEFKNLKFLYLLDEYENFTDIQQKYFNTLIRERKNPTCFKIGAKRYGIRTKKTLSTNEEIKRGSEYELFDIDKIFREDPENYKEFLKKICINRLQISHNEIDKDSFENYFEKPIETDFFNNINSSGRLHLLKLRNNLKYTKHKNITEDIVSNLSFNEDVILERTNILLFYKYWKKNNDLLNGSLIIKKSCLDFYYNKMDENNSHFKILDKFKGDIKAALYRENKLKQKTYTGFNNLIKISNGIPRHFLMLMKHIYKWNEFYGNRIFISQKNKINSESQLNALDDTAVWFIEDARTSDAKGYNIKDSIDRLCSYLRELRYSDIPPECSISSFSINLKVIPKEISEIVNFLENYSYLTKVGKGRRDKNLNTRNQTYQVNGLLAYEWELSLARRGVVSLDLKETKAIFFPDNESEFKKMRIENLQKYNSPFSSEISFPSLFD